MTCWWTTTTSARQLFLRSRLGNSFRCSVEVWFSVVQDSTGIWFCGFLCGYSTTTATATVTAEWLFKTLRVYVSSTTTTTATLTATTTAPKRRFEVLRVHCWVILSTDRGLVVLRFCEGAEKVLSMGDL